MRACQNVFQRDRIEAKLANIIILFCFSQLSLGVSYNGKYCTFCVIVKMIIRKESTNYLLKPKYKFSKIFPNNQSIKKSANTTAVIKQTEKNESYEGEKATTK